jgi:ATP/maltotriose-dependent transcriptional regulator MalT
MMTPRKRQELTDRERMLIELALDGLTNQEMAEMLEVSENTIKSELRVIYEKIRIKNRKNLHFIKK